MELTHRIHHNNNTLMQQWRWSFHQAQPRLTENASLLWPFAANRIVFKMKQTFSFFFFKLWRALGQKIFFLYFLAFYILHTYQAYLLMFIIIYTSANAWEPLERNRYLHGCMLWCGNKDNRNNYNIRSILSPCGPKLRLLCCRISFLTQHI